MILKFERSGTRTRPSQTDLVGFQEARVKSKNISSISVIPEVHVGIQWNDSM